MNGNKVLGIALALSLVLGIFLFLGNKKSSTETISTEEIKDEAASETEIKSFIDLNLSKATPNDANISQLLTYCGQAKEKGWLNLDQQLQYGKLKIETSPAPMEGIFILREILATDSNHVPTIETLGQMSIRSGQLEKAKKRYQKLLSLQPENEAYLSQLRAICEELGDSDCL